MSKEITEQICSEFDSMSTEEYKGIHKEATERSDGTFISDYPCPKCGGKLRWVHAGYRCTSCDKFFYKKEVVPHVPRKMKFGTMLNRLYEFMPHATTADYAWTEYHKVDKFINEEFGVDIGTAWRLYMYFKEDYDSVIKS